MKKQYSTLICDSREAKPGALFFCKGDNFKIEYLQSAVNQGIEAYVSETDYHLGVPCILVSDVHQAMAAMAKDYYDDPSSKLKLVGITGTKGKTTVLYYLKSILEQSHLCGDGRFGYLSTMEKYDGCTLSESHLTTPEILELNALLSNMVLSGIEYAGMEVSSQGLKYGRTEGINYCIGCFTNFSEDHISSIEHPDIEDYFNSKLKLIPKCRNFIVNMDCSRADEIIAECEKAKAEGHLKKIITFSCSGKSADWMAENIRKKNGKTVFNFGELGDICLSMPGLFNVENACIAALIAHELGASDSEIRFGLLDAKVKGRMEIYKSKDRNVVGIVDFAHNEASFEAIMSSVKKEYDGWNIVALFGCPGNKAYSRREDLPKVAAKYASYCYVTEDDPFNENASDICEEVFANLQKFGGKGEIIVSREEAIKKAIKDAEDKTVILFLAKGRDTYMHRKEYVPYPSDSRLVESLI